MGKSRDVTAEVRRNLLPYYNDKLSPVFGRAAKRMVVERLLADGEAPEGVADAVLLRGCELMVGYLEGGGRAEFPESLFNSLCCQALEGVREERARQLTAEVMRLLDGAVTLDESPLAEDAKVLAKVRQALALLVEPFARFLKLDLLEHRSEEEIRQELGLSDHEEYLHLKRLSVATLRRVIERVLH